MDNKSFNEGLEVIVGDNKARHQWENLGRAAEDEPTDAPVNPLSPMECDETAHVDLESRLSKEAAAHLPGWRNFLSLAECRLEQLLGVSIGLPQNFYHDRTVAVPHLHQNSQQDPNTTEALWKGRTLRKIQRLAPIVLVVGWGINLWMQLLVDADNHEFADQLYPYAFVLHFLHDHQ
ncbi:hypothetical protein NW756_004681 [Fusarium oxysporum]|nr:hypothetical protein NW763_011220 [Fusarium oxysporum]KAJ4065405.1 hypothetical protein NW753_003839 [Fusarium oxysporum]KAJ4095861.1 hypothetical protein NW756_004681 [Fusarium oxysporum]